MRRHSVNNISSVLVWGRWWQRGVSSSATGQSQPVESLDRKTPPWDTAAGCTSSAWELLAKWSCHYLLQTWHPRSEQRDISTVHGTFSRPEFNAASWYSDLQYTWLTDLIISSSTSEPINYSCSHWVTAAVKDNPTLICVCVDNSAVIFSILSAAAEDFHFHFSVYIIITSFTAVL